MEGGQLSMGALVRLTGSYDAYRDLPLLPTKSHVYRHYIQTYNRLRGLRLWGFFLMKGHFTGQGRTLKGDNEDVVALSGSRERRDRNGETQAWSCHRRGHG